MQICLDRKSWRPAVPKIVVVMLSLIVMPRFSRWVASLFCKSGKNYGHSCAVLAVSVAVQCAVQLTERAQRCPSRSKY